MKEIRGRLNSQRRRITVVVSRWNELVTEELLRGCLEELDRYGDANVQVIRVPGTWEIPPVLKRVLTATEKPEAIIALGCIVQGQTAHAGLLGADVGGALMSLQVEFGIPIAYGILSPETLEQALDRTGLKMGHKGREAALAALETLNVLDQL